jgi:splicing factor 3A subunit 1
VNGRDFLATIAQREQRNPQFDFLKPTHLLFSYFTALVDSYMKVINPSIELKERVLERTNLDTVFKYAVHRWSWSKKEEERKRQEQLQTDKERLDFQAIDWNDFVLVEQIDFPEDELFEIPGLTNLGISNNNQAVNGVGNGHAPSASSFPPPPLAPGGRTGVPPPPMLPKQQSSSQPMIIDGDGEDDIKVVSNYQPRIGGTAASSSSYSSAASSASSMTIDPVSGKPIPLAQLEEHMRIQLLDPKWKEEQKRFQEKQKETGYAEGGSIADSLKLFARKRGDIFGQATTGGGAAPNGSGTTSGGAFGNDGNDHFSAAAIAELEQQERRRAEETAKIQWDGFHSTMASTLQAKGQFPSSSYLPQPPVSNIGPSFPSSSSGMIPPPPPPAGLSFQQQSVFPGGAPPLMHMGMGLPPPPPPPPMFPGMMMPPPPAFLQNPMFGAMSPNAVSDESKNKKPRLDGGGQLFPTLFVIFFNSLCFFFSIDTS